MGTVCPDTVPTTLAVKLRSNDERSVRIMVFLTGLSGSCELPKELLNKQVACRVFQLLAMNLNRFEMLARAVNSGTGTLDVKKLCVYGIEWDDEDDTSKVLIHLPSGVRVEVAKGDRFGKNYKIADPCSDRDAMAVGPFHKKGQGIFLHAFFKDGTGPHVAMVPLEAKGRLAGMAETADTELNLQLEQARKGSFQGRDQEVPADEAKLEKKRKALAQARAAIKAKKARVEVDAVNM